MKVKFICDYLHYSGIFCDKASTRPEGCQSHHKAKKDQFYSEPECNKITRIEGYDRCRVHVRGHYQIQYVNRLQDKAQMFDQYLASNELISD